MSAFGSGVNCSESPGSQQQVLMQSSDAPVIAVDPAAFTGFIPMQPSFIQGLAPGSSAADGVSPSNALPSRLQLLQDAVQLCSVTPVTRDDKLDLLLSMMSSMFKVMLLDQVLGQSRGSSPLSLQYSSSSASSASCGDGQTAPAAAQFKCPACPITKPPLTEKSFRKHIQAWKEKVRGGVSRRQPKPGSCPGIRSLQHPLVAGLAGGIVERVDQIVDHTVTLLKPGANLAHTAMGTGNFQRVQAYFDSLLPH